MGISDYLYLLPLAAAAAIVVIFTVRRYSFSRLRLSSRDNVLLSACAKAFRRLLPKPGSRVHKVYRHFLRYTGLSVERVFRIKLFIFVVAALLCLLIKLTNISVYTRDILGKFDYRADLIYSVKSVINESEALNQEIMYFKQALRIIDSAIVKNLPKQQVENAIISLVGGQGSALLQPKATMANKIYYRICDYHKAREINFLLYAFLALAATFVLELGVFIYNFFAKAEARKELRFLKKLMILNGSIKPVDFMKLLKVLIDKSRYYKQTLIEIEELNKKNSIDNRDIYSLLARGVKDLDTKLFYEKLDQANNYNFDQAIANIEHEFQMENRASIRATRKKIEYIHAAGILGFMVLILVLVLYLIVPWMKEYDMNQFS